MISLLFLSPQIQDGDHDVKRSPLRKSLIFFSEPWNLENISMCLSTQNPTWLPCWLTLLAQVPGFSDVQLLLHLEIYIWIYPIYKISYVRNH